MAVTQVVVNAGASAVQQIRHGNAEPGGQEPEGSDVAELVDRRVGQDRSPVTTAAGMGCGALEFADEVDGSVVRQLLHSTLARLRDCGPGAQRGHKVAEVGGCPFQARGGCFCATRTHNGVGRRPTGSTCSEDDEEPAGRQDDRRCRRGRHGQQRRQVDRAAYHADAPRRLRWRNRQSSGRENRDEGHHATSSSSSRAP